MTFQLLDCLGVLLVKHALDEITKVQCQLVVWIDEVPVGDVFFVLQELIELAVLIDFDLFHLRTEIAREWKRASDGLEYDLANVENIRWSEILNEWDQ